MITDVKDGGSYKQKKQNTRYLGGHPRRRTDLSDEEERRETRGGENEL